MAIHRNNILKHCTIYIVAIYTSTLFQKNISKYNTSTNKTLIYIFAICLYQTSPFGHTAYKKVHLRRGPI